MSHLTLRLNISASIAKINYHNISVLYKCDIIDNFFLFARSGFHLKKDFYNEMLSQARQTVMASKPCTFLNKKNLIFVFHRPGFTYYFWKKELIAKVAFPFRFPANTDDLAPLVVVEFPPDVSQAHFYITYDITVDRPQWVPAPLVTQPVTQSVVPLILELPQVPRSVLWPEGTLEFVTAALNLIEHYPVLPSNPATNNFLKI